MNLLSSISTRFINLAPDEIDHGIYQALQTIGEFVSVDRSYVFVFSADQTLMDCTHEWCAPGIKPQISFLQKVPVGDLAWSNHQLLLGDSLHIPRVVDLPPEANAERREFQRQDIQSLVVVPMLYRGSAIGFIGFDSVREEKIWPHESIQLLHLVADILVNALQHKQAQAIQAGQRQFLELLARGGEFSETLHTLVRIIEEQWPGMLGLVLLLDEDGQHLHVGAAVSLPEDYVQSIEGLEIGPLVGSCGTASYLGQRVIVEDIDTDPRWDGLRSLAQHHGLRACWSEPVLSPEGNVVGTFAMYYRHPRMPTDAELRTIETAAHLVGVAIEYKHAQEALRSANETLEQRVEDRTQALATLLEVSHTVNSTLELDVLLDLILDRLKSVVDYTGASILTLGDDCLAVRAYRGPVPQDQVLCYCFPLADVPANREVIQRRQPVIIPDVRDGSSLAHLFQEGAADEFDTTFAYVRSWLGVPMIVKGEVIGMLTLDHNEPAFFSAQHAELVHTFANQVAVAVENARLWEAEQQRQRELQTLLDITATASRSLDLDEMLRATLDHLVALVGASRAGVLLLADDTGEPAVPMIRPERPIAPDDLADLLQATEQVVAKDQLVYVAEPEPGALLPLRVRGQVRGVLGIIGHEGESFSPDQIVLFASIADQLGVAVENAWLYEQAEESAVAAERTRLARDLHDAVTQTLFSSSLIAEVLPVLWERSPEEGRRRLAELRELTRGALAEMRTLLLELRPSALVEANLGDLLRQLAESITGRARVPVHVEVTGECDLPADVKVALYRIAQEALNNVAKHAGAAQASVQLRCQGDAVELIVSDDGSGFDPHQQPAHSLGLGIMGERAEAIKSELSIKSQPGAGTTVQALWRKNNHDSV